MLLVQMIREQVVLCCRRLGWPISQDAFPRYGDILFTVARHIISSQSNTSPGVQLLSLPRVTVYSSPTAAPKGLRP